MVLTPHALIGTAIYTLIYSPIVGLPLAFLSHFLGDWLPHTHYHKEGPKTRGFQFSPANFFKVGADFSIGMGLCGLFALLRHDVFFLAAGFFAMLPDGFSFFELLGKRYRFVHILMLPILWVQYFHHWIHIKRGSRAQAYIVQFIITVGALLITILGRGFGFV